jgi:effector-binding domain-containing protein
MHYQVTVQDVDARPTAVVKATTTWREFPSLWQDLSEQVWTCLRAAGISTGCRNVMVYLDNVPHIEVGVLLNQPCPLTGRVVRSTLPAGPVATTVHRGPYRGLASAHRAVLEWCSDNALRPVGPRWEIYGPHDDDDSKVWTEIYWLLSR